MRDLAFIRPFGEGLAIGAMTRQQTVETHRGVARRIPLLAEATRCIGHPQIRARGTIGGSLAHADPASELPAAAAALDARFVLSSVRGERVLDCEQFFAGYLTTALEPDELLTEVRLPALPSEAGWAFLEIARRHGDFALVGVAAVLEQDGDRRCRSARLVFTGVGPGPVRVPEAEQALLGQEVTEASVAEAVRAAQHRLDPPSDIHATADYRRQVAGVLAGRAIMQAAERIREPR